MRRRTCVRIAFAERQAMFLPSIQEVLNEEFHEVETSRKLRLDASMPRPAAEKSLIGLAFSGGGIRSATFNLGVLQALARKSLLRSLDFVSTVSGGGYIGGWLMGWMYHHQIGIKEIEQRLSEPPMMPKEASDPPEVHFLREYSNYLTPRKGLLGADFLAFLASYLRNTLLNQIILVLTLLSLLLAPRTIGSFLHVLEDLEEAMRNEPHFTLQAIMRAENFALALGIGFGLVAVVFMGLNLETVDPHEGKRDPWYAKAWAVHAFIIVPLLVSSALFTYGFAFFLEDWGIIDHPRYRAPLVGVALYFSMWTGACLVRRIVHYKKARRVSHTPLSKLVMSTAALTGVLIGYLFVPFGYLLIPYDDPVHLTRGNWHNLTYGTPVCILIMLVAGVIHIGLMGRGMSDAHREWWGRLGGWLLLFAILWLGLFWIAIYFPPSLGRVFSWEQSTGHHVSLGAGLMWILSTVYGVFFGKSEKTSHWNPEAPATQKFLAVAAKLTPYIFILGLLLGLSIFASFAANWATGLNLNPLVLPSETILDSGVPTLCLLFIGGAWFVSWRVDINEFSIHYLYRNRLVRCYLGATVPKRNAQPFTGFSEKDNFPLGDLKIPEGSNNAKDGRPLPILNTSLNVVRGKELALQTRKARSFALTPIYGGFTRALPCKRDWQAAYARTEKLACRLPGFKDGVTMGTAVAISGAAASPNMGSYSDPGLGFLMTLFDVRLGWWIGNPRKKQWENGSPRVGFACLLQELLGATSDDSKYVYLSDGGHFENLAVYELVRRGCKLIIVSDASCDPGYSFGDLHNAIEKCRTDFGVEIVMDGLDRITPKPCPEDVATKRAASHFAVGKIRYNPNAPEADGTIIYLKPALVACDPSDVLAYGEKDKAFPHDTTANQWFDEDHFENYRELGMTSGMAASQEIAAQIKRVLGWQE